MAKRIETELSTGLDDDPIELGEVVVDTKKEKKQKEPKEKKDKKKEKEALPKDFFDALQDVMGDKFSMNNMDTFEPVPFFISTGSYAINWIIANDMLHGGFPATKLSLVTGECLGPNEKIKIRVSDEFSKLLK